MLTTVRQKFNFSKLKREMLDQGVQGGSTDTEASMETPRFLGQVGAEIIHDLCNKETPSAVWKAPDDYSVYAERDSAFWRNHKTSMYRASLKLMHADEKEAMAFKIVYRVMNENSRRQEIKLVSINNATDEGTPLTANEIKVLCNVLITYWKLHIRDRIHE